MSKLNHLLLSLLPADGCSNLTLATLHFKYSSLIVSCFSVSFDDDFFAVAFIFRAKLKLSTTNCKQKKNFIGSFRVPRQLLVFNLIISK